VVSGCRLKPVVWLVSSGIRMQAEACGLAGVVWYPYAG